MVAEVVQQRPLNMNVEPDVSYVPGNNASYAIIEPQDGLGILVADNGKMKGIVIKDPLSGAYRSTNYGMSLSDAIIQLVSGTLQDQPGTG